MTPRVLIVDDDAGLRYALSELLGADYEVVAARDGEEALGRLGREAFDLVLTDLRMPRRDGLSLLEAARALETPPRVVLITAHGSERHAVQAMKLGAYDYLRKPFDPDEVLAIVRRATEAARLQHDNERLSSALVLARAMLFASPAMERLAVLIQRAAARDVTVLVTGESGTGKERVAEALVAGSPRAARPFVRFNCAALTPELADAELFGHTRGAFTGATRDRPGLFREADRGTLLLDEIGELDPGTQAKLLRVLQEGEVRPVGEDRVVKVDVRVIASTHRNLKDEVAAGRFRQDLLWRLDVVHVHVPPLRERPDDVPVLVRHFVDRFARRFGLTTPVVPDPLMARLQAWSWPGNVRELEHAMERLVALSPDGELDPALLPGPEASAEPALDLRARVEAYERGLVVEALRTAHGNRTEAARLLGIGRVTLHDKLKRYGLGDEPAQ